MNQATRDFIRQHADEDVRQLALRGTRDPEVDLPFALDQIAGRQKARTKLPSWAAIEGIVYPPHLSMEQCSSEATARYKARLAGGGRRLTDLTGGFGVDFSFMAAGFREAVYVERQAPLCAVASENFRTLGLSHAEVVCADSEDYLRLMPHADLIFLDPARRDAHGARTYGIADCTPNVLELLPMLCEKADRLLLKLSPMLDWRKAVTDLEHDRQETASAYRVSQVHIVAVENECKELLILVEGGRLKVEGDMLRVVCVNLLSDGSEQCFEYSPSTLHLPPSTKNSPPITQHPTPNTHHYLYEPNAALMKAGCFAELSARFGIAQLEANSHLFVSPEPVSGFPGRQFEILRITSLNKRELREALAGIDRANIAVRNFPLSPEALRRRLKLKDGGETYIFATTLPGTDHRLIVCRRL